MGQALYRTYRSKKLAEVLGQEHVTTALANALKKGNISHAYLLTGPRGVGKTSTARILAFEINDLPYDEDRQHLDIIEIDAASNRRIDEIRDLRDKVHIAPTSAKYKVYIIDEVHMLTKEAFNALLKTLEEPPAHVVFILATTEAHKLPETIISRTQRFAFKPIDRDKVVEHLRHIAKEEKISISDDALQLIAAHGEGSFRDSISLLDQIRNTKSKVGRAEVEAVLGLASEKLIADLLASLEQHDSVTLAKLLKTMHDQGYEAAGIAKQLSAELRQAVLSGKRASRHSITMKLLGDLLQVPASPDPRIALEIALLDAALSGSPQVVSSVSAVPAPAESTSVKSSKAAATTIAAPTTTAPIQKPGRPAVAKTTREEATKESTKPSEPNKSPLDTAEVGSDLILTDEAWELVLGAIKQKHNTIYSMLGSARPHFEPGRVTLEFSYAFHQKRLNESHNKEIIANIIQGVTGSDIHISCMVGEGKQRTRPATPLPPTDGEIVHNATPAASLESSTISTISDIFGGGEVLES